MEDLLYRAAGSVVDPVLGQSVSSLQWLHRRLAVSEDGRALRILLRMPSLLHPRLTELKVRVREVAESALRSSQTQIIAESATVEAIANRPVPYAARLLLDDEARDELLSSLGPGLASVSHVVAVYSCKVRYAPRREESRIACNNLPDLLSAHCAHRFSFFFPHRNLIVSIKPIGRGGQVHGGGQPGVPAIAHGWEGRTPGFGRVRSIPPGASPAGRCYRPQVAAGRGDGPPHPSQ